MDDFRKKKTHFQQLLIELVKDNGGKPLKIIIFCKTKRGCDNVEKMLKWDNILQAAISYESCAIHGDKEQWERDGIYTNFKKPITNKTNILIATDVASRGLDVKDISVVINYDMPMSGFDNYVHRIGRTGRAGAKGTAISYIVPTEDKAMVGPLIALLKKTN
jgi:ATP-dependent RNA helicase DDX5/DBP2|tara:strand:- start:107 stop:592 length:486 start_codon:yes stop_codon:yes gene_type:complete